MIFKYIKRFIREEKLKKLHPTCKFGDSFFIHPKAVIGRNCTIGSFVRIGKNVVLKDGSSIGSYATLDNITVGERSVLERGVIVTGLGDGYITIGKDCYVGIYCNLDFSANIEIGDTVHFAASTGVWTHSSFKMVMAGKTMAELNSPLRETQPIKVGSNVYVGSNCVIYPGVIIGSFVAIAPNSAVSKNVDSNTMVGGVPAKFIKTVKKFDS